MFGWIFAAIYLLVIYSVNKLWAASHPRQYTYTPGRKWRTSRVTLFMKAWFWLIPPAVAVSWMVGGSLLNGVVGAFFGMLAFTIFMEIGMRLCMAWWNSDNPAYAALLRDGWDPFWDTWMMGLINTDPEEVRAGQPPKDIANYTPPANWTITCPNCGAAQPGPIFWCWRCGQGYENGCEKICCPDCNTTFCESVPGAGRTMAVTCPGCKKAWFMPSYQGPDTSQTVAVRPRFGSGDGRLPLDLN